MAAINRVITRAMARDDTHSGEGGPQPGQKTDVEMDLAAERDRPTDRPAGGGSGATDSLAPVARTEYDPVTVGGDETAESAIRDLAQIDTTDVDQAGTESELLVVRDEDSLRDFRQKQTEDDGLQSYWTRARLGGDTYKVINELLHRRALPGMLSGDEGYVLVVPACLESETIRIVHDSPFAGHQGVKKTLARV